MSDHRPSITCPRCGATSYNPWDVHYGYCGRCHWWTSDPDLSPFYVEANPKGEPDE